MFDEDETAEQIEARRNRTKQDYRELYDSVSKVLFTHDPIGINFETNDDEYEPEVDTILPRLKNCNSAADVLTVIHEEFTRWFHKDNAGEKERYEQIAEEIWLLWQNRNSTLK